MGTDVPPEWYKPYGDSISDVPPMANFGTGYRYHITGLFHDPMGYPTQRLDEIDAWIEGCIARLSVICTILFCMRRMGWKGQRQWLYPMEPQPEARAAAIHLARQRRHKVGLVTLLTIWPFAEDLIASLARTTRRLIVPEMNLGQLALEVERIAGRHKVVRVNRRQRRDGDA